MQRVILQAYGGPELFVLEDAPTLSAGPGELLVDVEAAGVNYLDVYQRRGRAARPPPCTLGLEGVGRVQELGTGVVPGSASVKVGSRVAWMDVAGSYASQIVIPADRAIPVPDTLTTNETLLFQALTAQYLVSEYRAIRRDDWVLVHAAAGGVGQILVQWFKHLGARVVATTSSERKAQSVRALGADSVIIYGEAYAFADEVKAMTAGKGVVLAIDGVGAATFAASLNALSLGGTVVSIGAASGPAPDVPTGQLSRRCLRVAGGNVFSYVADPQELHRRAAEVLSGIEAGWLAMGQGTAFTLADAADAHRALEGRDTIGKLYLVPDVDGKGGP
jgi:NADPH:quinone reductase